jgi:hypothetical protein
MTCANCASEAVYIYSIAPETRIAYCTRHLPSFLNKHKENNQLELAIPTEPVASATPAPKPPKAKRKETAPVKEAPVEEAPAEEPAPAEETITVEEPVSADEINS